MYCGIFTILNYHNIAYFPGAVLSWDPALEATAHHRGLQPDSHTPHTMHSRICAGDSFSNNAVESNKGTTVKRSSVPNGVRYCSSVSIFSSLYVTAKTKTDEDMGRGLDPCLSDPHLWSDELSRVPLRGGTKQYERFRDTIFLNYWAIVFVQDVVFLF